MKWEQKKKSCDSRNAAAKAASCSLADSTVQDQKCIVKIMSKGMHYARLNFMSTDFLLSGKNPHPFSDAPSHLYNRVFPSVRPSVSPSVRLSRAIFRRVLGAYCAVYSALLDVFLHLCKRVCPSVRPSVYRTRVTIMFI